jgi:DNA modification methylase
MYDLRQVTAVWEEEQRNGVYDYEKHVAICEAIDERGHLPATYMLAPPDVTGSPTAGADWVWDDIVRMRVLNAEQSRKRVENHVCPLPFDIVTRTIRLYSNEGDLVLDPFAGLMTVGYKAIEMGRKAYMIELSGDYFAFGVDYVRRMERQVMTPTLFDYLAMQQGPGEAVSAGENGAGRFFGQGA